MVGSIDNIVIVNPAKYLPKIICNSVIGFVTNNSMVPDLFSSEKERMVMAGIKNKNTHGAMLKKLSMLAKPYSNIEVSGNTHTNIPVTNRNTTIAIYAISELKNPASSFLKIVSIFIY
jgi:hypothetical protein